jgi:hypothetical protein
VELRGFEPRTFSLRRLCRTTASRARVLIAACCQCTGCTKDEPGGTIGAHETTLTHSVTGLPRRVAIHSGAGRLLRGLSGHQADPDGGFNDAVEDAGIVAEA